MLLKIVYNQFRLRQFPGKFNWCLSDLVYVYYASKGDIHYRILDLHQKYGIISNARIIVDKGDVVRIQPNHLSFTSAQAIQDIHGFKGKSVKGELYENLYRPTGANAGENMLASTFGWFLCCANDSDSRVHQKFRKLFGPFFTNNAIKMLEPKIQLYLDSLVLALRAEKNDLDMSLYCKCFTFDVSSLRVL